MKKINLLIFCTLFCNLVSAREQALPKIFHAVRNRDKEAVRNELYNCADCTVKDKDGNTVLHIAAQNGFKEIAELLLEYNDNWFSHPTLPKTDDVNNDGDTAAHVAVNSDDHDYENRVDVLQYLLKKNPELMKKTNKKNLSPAFAAIKKDDPRFIRIFTAYKLDINNHKRKGETLFTYAIKKHKPKTILYCAKTSLSNVANNDNKTPVSLAIDIENIQLIELLKENLNTFIANTSIKPIHYAAAHGKYKALDHIINNNVSVDEPDRDGNPPIFHAIDSNDEQMLNHLLYLGASLKKCNNLGEDALAIATYNKHFHLINVLKTKHNVDIDARDKKGQTSLMRSSIEQNHEVMEALIDLGANIRITDNGRENILHKIARSGDRKGAQIALKYDKLLLSDVNQDGNTPVFTAIQNDQFNLAQLLLDAGSPIDTINKKGETIIHELSKKGNSLLLPELLKKIKPHFINHKNLNGETAIFFAAQNDDAASIKNLILHKAEYRAITNINGLTPMHYAAGSDAIEAMKELERQGASLTDCTPEGNTPGHIAAGNGKIKSIRYLQSKNGILDVYNKKGDNAFSYAALQGQLEVAKLLLREEYFINGIVSRTRNSLANNLTHKNQDVHKFLTQKHDDRVRKCKDVYDVYMQTKNLITENQRLTFTLAENNFFRLFMYAPSQLDGEFATTSDALYYMTEAQRTRLFNHYLKSKDNELNQKINFEREITNNRLEKQNAIAQQQAAEQAAKERIRQQSSYAPLSHKASEDCRKATEDRQQTEQERIAAQQGTSIAEQKAELERIAAAKYAKDIEANNKRMAEEKARLNKRIAEEDARMRAQEDARAQQAHAAENKHIAQAGQPAPVVVAEQGECNLCFETTTVEPVRCPHCTVGSARTCDACINTWINNCKANKKPLTCPFCNQATLSEKLKQ